MLLKGALYSPASAHFLPADNVMNEKKQTSQKKKTFKKPTVCAGMCVCFLQSHRHRKEINYTLYGKVKGKMWKHFISQNLQKQFLE